MGLRGKKKISEEARLEQLWINREDGGGNKKIG
jgi:hypothetical protein